MSGVRRLVVMRHARAEPYAATDHERALTARGQAEATAAGEYLAAEGVVPDFALISSAARTQATWEAVRSACGTEAVTVVEDTLYGAQPDTMMESLLLIPEETTTAILVGHNPGAAYLAYLLEDGHGDREVVRRLLEGFPTAALAVFEVDSEWSQVGPGVCRITHFHVGRPPSPDR